MNVASLSRASSFEVKAELDSCGGHVLCEDVETSFDQKKGDPKTKGSRNSNRKKNRNPDPDGTEERWANLWRSRFSQRFATSSFPQNPLFGFWFFGQLNGDSRVVGTGRL